MSRCQDEATLQALLAEAETAEAGFEAAVKAAGHPDKWTLYRIDAFGENWPAQVRAAHDRLQAASNAFYTARFGLNGVLGRIQSATTK